MVRKHQARNLEIPGSLGFLAPWNDEIHDFQLRDADRIDRDPDVVAACRDDGGDRHDPGFPTGGDDLCDRRVGGIAGLDRTARRDRRIGATAARMDRRGSLTAPTASPPARPTPNPIA